MPQNSTHNLSQSKNTPTVPHDPEAEASVLSAMILSQDILSECLTLLKDEDFFITGNRMIFRALREMFDHGQDVDPVLIADHLNSKGELDRAGGLDYLTGLGDNAFALASWSSHVEILTRDTTLRQLIGVSASITQMAYDAPEDTKEVINKAESALFAVTQRNIDNTYSSLENVLDQLYNDLGEAAANKKPLGINTGYSRIDRDLLGMRPGQMIVVGARPGVGKTSFALNLAVNAAAQGATVAFFSLEMSATEVAQRLLSSQARINLQDIRGANIRENQWADIIRATGELADLDIMIDDHPETTVTEIRAKARRMLAGKENGLVIIDYLQLVSPPSGRFRADSRATEVSEMSRGIKIMAKDLQVPVIALSQLNRSVEQRGGSKRPQLSDLRESGSIEQDADIVILLDRSTTDEEAEREDRPDKNVTEFILAKNRSGPTDVVQLMFLPGSTKFVEVDTHH